MKLPLKIMRIKRRYSSSIFHARFIVYKFVVVISAYNVKKVSYAESFYCYCFFELKQYITFTTQFI